MDLCNRQLVSIERQLLGLLGHPFLQGREGLGGEVRAVAGVVALLQVRVALMREAPEARGRAGGSSGE